MGLACVVALVPALLAHGGSGAGEAPAGLGGWPGGRAAASRYLYDRFERSEHHESDSNRHASTLRMLAAQCHSVAEVGLRSVLSTWPLLQGLADSSIAGPEEPKWHFAVGAVPFQHAAEAGRVASSLGIDYKFLQGDTLTTGLGGDVDLLFLDTFRAYAQLRAELRLHARHARRFIAIHGTQTDGRRGECVRAGRRGLPAHEACGEGAARLGVSASEVRGGLWAAMEEFLALRPEWRVSHHFSTGSGLTVLERQVPLPHEPRIGGWGPRCNFTSHDLTHRRFEVAGHLWTAHMDVLQEELRRLQAAADRESTAWAHARLAVLRYVLSFSQLQGTFDFLAPLQEALRLDPVQPQALLLLFSQNCGNFPRWDFDGCTGSQIYAEQLLAKLLDNHGPLREADLALGSLLLRRGALDEARARLSAAVLAAPRSRQTAGHVGEVLLRAGLTSESEEVFESAVDRGLWHSVHQRPRLSFFPAMLPFGDGFLDEDQLPPELKLIRSGLEAGWATFRKEALEALENPLHVTKERRKTPAGSWSEVHIMSSGGWNEDPRVGCRMELFPSTCRLLEKVFMQVPYTLMLRARLTIVEPPLTVINRHGSNAPGRLRMQCALAVPRDATNLLQVGAEARNMTEEGRCHWFDESFEHDLRYEHGSLERVALYVDVEHPALRREHTRGTAELEPEIFSNIYWLQTLCRGDMQRQLAAL